MARSKLEKGKKDILLGVIPGRSGSKGIKNKNLRKVLGLPLIAYTVKDALGCRQIHKVIVTTDSLKIASAAEKAGAQAPFIRPKALAKDQTPMLAVLKHALIECERIYQRRIKGIVLFDPSSPVRVKSEIEKAIGIFLKKNPDLVITVTKSKRNPYFNLVKKNQKGYAQTVLRGNFARRQDAPPTYDIANNCWIFSRRAVLKGLRLPRKTLLYEIKGPFIDIDKKEDLDLFKWYLNQKGNLWPKN